MIRRLLREYILRVYVEAVKRGERRKGGALWSDKFPHLCKASEAEELYVRFPNIVMPHNHEEHKERIQELEKKVALLLEKLNFEYSDNGRLEKGKEK